MSKIIAPIAFIVATLGLYFTYISPAYDTLQAMQQQEDRLDKALEDFRVLEQTATRLRAEYQALSGDGLNRLTQLLPDAIDSTRLIIDLDNLASANNIFITNFTVPQVRGSAPASTKGSTVTSEEVLGSATFELTCSGEYEDIQNMLASLESSLTLMDVVRFEVHKPAQSVAKVFPNLLEYEVELKVYWLYPQ